MDWSAGDLAIEVRSWTPRVNVVSQALTGVDEHWRLATAILDFEIPVDPTGLRLRDLLDRTRGLTVAAFGQPLVALVRPPVLSSFGRRLRALLSARNKAAIRPSRNH